MLPSCHPKRPCPGTTLALLLLGLCLQWGVATPAQAQRVALLIGNASYPTAPLRNPPSVPATFDTFKVRDVTYSDGPAALHNECLVWFAAQVPVPVKLVCSPVGSAAKLTQELVRYARAG